MKKSKEAFVGFDSAWAENNNGSIGYVVLEAGKPVEIRMPEVASFADAVEIINRLREECHDVLVAIDQPIVVANETGSRPVDRIAASLMGTLRSATQPANRGKADMFGDGAPIWRCIQQIDACLDFDHAKFTRDGINRNCDMIHLLEVYPALALPALAPAFMELRRDGHRWAARYKPSMKHFNRFDWEMVCATVRRQASFFGLGELATWAERARKLGNPNDSDQDNIDAAICLLIALKWRYPRLDEMHVIGNLETGYIVNPVSEQTFNILDAASRRVFA